MAGRSDFNSLFPRQLKRQLALRSTGNAHRDGEIRRIMIAAHKHELEMKNKILRGGENVDDATHQALVQANAPTV